MPDASGAVRRLDDPHRSPVRFVISIRQSHHRGLFGAFGSLTIRLVFGQSEKRLCPMRVWCGALLALDAASTA
jgi:hypothetical protein